MWLGLVWCGAVVQCSEVRCEACFVVGLQRYRIIANCALHIFILNRCFLFGGLVWEIFWHSDDLYQENLTLIPVYVYKFFPYNKTLRWLYHKMPSSWDLPSEKHKDGPQIFAEIYSLHSEYFTRTSTFLSLYLLRRHNMLYKGVTKLHVRSWYLSSFSFLGKNLKMRQPSQLKSLDVDKFQPIHTYLHMLSISCSMELRLNCVLFYNRRNIRLFQGTKKKHFYIFEELHTRSLILEVWFSFLPNIILFPAGSRLAALLWKSFREDAVTATPDG